MISNKDFSKIVNGGRSFPKFLMIYNMLLKTMVKVMSFYLDLSKPFNPLTAKLFKWNFHPLEVVSR